MKAYVSGITNDNFLVGMLVMFESLKEQIKNDEAEFCCFVTDGVSKNACERIERHGIRVYHAETRSIGKVSSGLQG